MSIKNFVALFFLFTSSVFANFAVVDMQKVENEAVVTKGLKTNVEKAVKALEKKANDAKIDIEKKAAELQKLAQTLSPDALEKRRVSLQKEVLKTEGDLQAQDGKIRKAQVEALDKVSNEIKKITKQIAVKKGLDAVVTNVAVIYHSDKIDITDEVIKSLNKKLKTVPFDVK